MNVKDLKDEYLGRYIKVTDTFYTYIGILVRGVTQITRIMHL